MFGAFSPEPLDGNHNCNALCDNDFTMDEHPNANDCCPCKLHNLAIGDPMLATNITYYHTETLRGGDGAIKGVFNREGENQRFCDNMVYFTDSPGFGNVCRDLMEGYPDRACANFGTPNEMYCNPDISNGACAMCLHYQDQDDGAGEGSTSHVVDATGFPTQHPTGSPTDMPTEYHSHEPIVVDAVRDWSNMDSIEMSEPVLLMDDAETLDAVFPDHSSHNVRRLLAAHKANPKRTTFSRREQQIIHRRLGSAENSTGSCSGQCGGFSGVIVETLRGSQTIADCWCDATCNDFNTCCHDFEMMCPETLSVHIVAPRASMNFTGSINYDEAADGSENGYSTGRVEPWDSSMDETYVTPTMQPTHPPTFSAMASFMDAGAYPTKDPTSPPSSPPVNTDLAQWESDSAPLSERNQATYASQLYDEHMNYHEMCGDARNFICNYYPHMLTETLESAYYDSSPEMIFPDVFECSSGCPDVWLSDGMCDDSCNNEACGYDHGDCDGTSDYYDYYGSQCSEDCPNHWLSDGWCDDSCNNGACGYDHGDCDDTSGSDDDTSAGSDSSGEEACENHGYTETECGAIGCCQFDGEFGECHSAVGDAECRGSDDTSDYYDYYASQCSRGYCPDHWLSDGMCDDACNNEACGYDRSPDDETGGDCDFTDNHFIELLGDDDDTSAGSDDGGSAGSDDGGAPEGTFAFEVHWAGLECECQKACWCKDERCEPGAVDYDGALYADTLPAGTQCDWCPDDDKEMWCGCDTSTGKFAPGGLDPSQIKWAIEGSEGPMIEAVSPYSRSWPPLLSQTRINLPPGMHTIQLWSEWGDGWQGGQWQLFWAESDDQVIGTDRIAITCDFQNEEDVNPSSWGISAETWSGDPNESCENPWYWPQPSLGFNANSHHTPGSVDHDYHDDDDTYSYYYNSMGMYSRNRRSLQTGPPNPYPWGVGGKYSDPLLGADGLRHKVTAPHHTEEPQRRQLHFGSGDDCTNSRNCKKCHITIPSPAQIDPTPPPTPTPCEGVVCNTCFGNWIGSGNATNGGCSSRAGSMHTADGTYHSCEQCDHCAHDLITFDFDALTCSFTDQDQADTYEDNLHDEFCLMDPEAPECNPDTTCTTGNAGTPDLFSACKACAIAFVRTGCMEMPEGWTTGLVERAPEDPIAMDGSNALTNEAGGCDYCGVTCANEVFHDIDHCELSTNSYEWTECEERGYCEAPRFDSTMAMGLE
jgi:hypothetical protein